MVAGYARFAGKRDVLFARFNPDGGIDRSFGTDGYVTYGGAGDGTDIGFGAAIQGDGKIVVVGETLRQGSQDALLLRFNEDGTPDRSFGTAGALVYNGAAGEADRGFAAAITQDGGTC